MILYNNRGDFMHQFIGEQWAYNLFNNIAIYATIISSLFYFKSKRKSISLYSRRAIYFVSRASGFLGKFVEIILVSLESAVFAGIALLSTNFNWPFGNLVGTGANYFGMLFSVSVIWFLISLIFIANPLKQIDIATMFLPTHLFLVKIACYCQGCCWGIPWEYGPYNHHPDHPGNQVPVQAIEAFWAVLIFIFLLCYRKKAKTGTMFPMYMILYGGTRFFSEFFTAAYPDIIGPFNTYQLLCVLSIIIGIILLIIVKLFGDKMQAVFEKPHKKFELMVAEKEEQDAIKLARKKAQAEADEIKRLKNIKHAREKAKARKK